MQRPLRAGLLFAVSGLSACAGGRCSQRCGNLPAALDDSTLGQTVRDIAGPMGIEVRPDREPERGLLRRSDHWPFMQNGVPAVSFIFGYDPGTEAERRHREWYTTRYHLPKHDMSTPINHEAAGAFNRFFFALTERITNADAPPQWLPDSPYRPTGR